MCWRVGNAFQADFTVFSKIYSEMPGPSVLENGEKFVVLLCSESGVSVFRNRRGYSIIEVMTVLAVTSLFGREVCEVHKRHKITKCVQDLENYRAVLVFLEGKQHRSDGKAEKLVDRVNKGLRSLNNVERVIIVGRYMDGLSWEEIADRSYYSERWCRVLRDRALEKLSISMYGVIPSNL